MNVGEINEIEINEIEKTDNGQQSSIYGAGAGESRVTAQVYPIEHSSFLVELPSGILLFDYYRGEVPKVEEDRTVYIFVSHRHYDHFSEGIFSLFPNAPRRVYIISDDVDIWEEQRKTILDRGDILVQAGAHAQYKAENVCVRTLRSNDEGVAFMLEMDHICIYHGGDLNAWYWRDEPKQYNDGLARIWSREMERLSGEHFHIAFQAVDPRLEDHVFDGARDLLSHARVDCLFAMHMWGRFEVAHTLCNESFVKRGNVRVFAPDEGVQSITLERRQK